MRVAFYAINGVGLGHVVRMVSEAKTIEARYGMPNICLPLSMRERDVLGLVWWF